MFALYELIEMLPETFEPNFSKRLNELFLFLRNTEKKLTEEEAAEMFMASREKGKYFNKLKNTLKIDLANYVIKTPSIWVNAGYKAFYDECYKSFAAYKILLISGKRKAGIDLAKMLLPKLRKAELHSLIYTVVIDLRFHYSSMEISPGQSKKYNKIVQQQLEVLNAESFVREYHSKVCLICTTKESYSKVVTDCLIDAAERVVPFLKIGSSYLNRYIYNIIISRYVIEFDYENVIKYTNEALLSFSPDYPNYKATKFIFMQMKLPALIATGKLKEAKELAREATLMMPKGNFNWHLSLIRRIMVCLHAGDYQEAYDLYKAHGRQECHFPVLAEYWSILKGYLYFLIKVDQVEPYSEERFNLGKFLNEVPIYSKDKAGQNINILIIQILIRMQREQFGVLIDWIESLSTYARTYTRNPETQRANLFIKMIIQMEKASFHKTATERKTQKLRERLDQTPLKFGQNLAVEIIPYLILWEEMMKMLADKFRAMKTNKRRTKR